MTELRLRSGEHTADRRGAAWIRCACERDMPFAGQQSRGGIQSNPAGSGEVHFGPRMQIRKIGAGPSRPLQRLYVGLQLNQITGNKSPRESQMAQDLHQ